MSCVIFRRILANGLIGCVDGFLLYLRAFLRVTLGKRMYCAGVSMALWYPELPIPFELGGGNAVAGDDV